MTRRIILAIIVLFTSFVLHAQVCADSFLGSKTLYKSQQDKFSKAPRKYEPVFINHVGRHGARHLTKDVAVSYAYKLLQKADSMNQLNENGKLLKEKVLRLEKVEKRNFESISYEGQQEQWLIAERMYDHYRKVFDHNNPVLNVAVTNKIRTVQTSEAFLTKLKTKVNNPQITSQVNDTTLRFYDLSPVYLEYEENGNWIKLLDELKEAKKFDELAKHITGRFFTPEFLKNLKDKDFEKFTSDLFGFVSIFYSIQKEIEDNGFQTSEVDITSLFTCPELKTIGQIDDAEDFFVKGPGTNKNGIQVKIAVPLLADFINTTDDYIKSKAVNAQLRFTHAEAIAPFAALLDIPYASETTDNPEDISKVWSPAEVMPLSSNIQWILYKKKNSNNYLVKIMLNEKEVAIEGLSTKTFPFYKWKDVRYFYKDKIEKFGSTLDENGYKYLQRIH